MKIQAFSPIGNNVPISATTASAATQLTTSPTSDQRNIRVVNRSTTSVLFVRFGASGLTVTTSTGSPVLPASERIFTFPPAATHIATILDTGTATVDAQLGQGV
ncbi:MAG: hypothetical protein E6Q97_13070 [Desulfurellales bacterium]|nr:MAG: hypothetical protein E6Q97_13070 [Desulfurellales bacterium]